MTGQEMEPPSDCVAEMDRAVSALALELPVSVWRDVNARWSAVRETMTETP